MKKKKKKELNSINIDDSLLQQRRLFLFGEINEDSAKKVIKKLFVLDQENHNPIQLRIHSGGGCISSGLAIIDAMKEVKSPIITYISGEACSMAAMISICGDERIMTKNSLWMFHPPSGGVSTDYFSFQKDRMQLISLIEKISEKIMKKHTKLTKKEREKANHSELWYDAKTCKRKGIVDRVK